MIEFTLKRTSTAPIERVFDVVTDHRGMADFAWSIRRSTLDQEGIPPPNGVGAQRRLVSFGSTFVEEIREYERPSKYVYSVVSGVPIRDHLATVTLRTVGEGTEVTWHVHAVSKVRGVDWLLNPMSKSLIRGLLKGALKVAEGRA